MKDFKKKYPFFFLVQLFWIIHIPSQPPNKKIDSLESVVKTAVRDTNLVDTYNLLCRYYSQTGNYAQAKLCGDSALTIATAVKSTKLISRSHNSLGIIYYHLGNYPEALHHDLLALQLEEKTNDLRGKAITYSNLAVVYYKLKNYEQALACNQNALEIKKKFGDRRGISYSLENIGIVFFDLGKYKEALDNFNQALLIKQELKDSFAMGASFNSIAAAYIKLGEYDKALECALRSVQIKKATGDEQGVEIAFINLADIYMKKNNAALAFSYISEALPMAEKTRDKESIMDCHKMLSEFMAAKGKYAEAFEHYKLYVLYRDSLSNEDNTKKLVQTQMQYDFDKKSAADSIKNSEAKKFGEIKHQQEISRQKTFTYGGIAGFLVMIVVAGISYNAFRNKKKANVEIQRQKHLVEEKQREILDSIYYARRIQRALITSEKYIDRKLNELNKQGK